ncbi:hypothetical protein M407DRAFT_216700 [Tulasnella calospora MUT 4182]|uniref:GED domain-containing protein n=1 Tax=Tulasnella calospora MUT 4182 TaxID=1051891 RepID=A0A0C3QCI7_9AGAM|nr:hypothetical protein M407DRAFT_216700 [Tulasnella calospora MUT 4182]
MLTFDNSIQNELDLPKIVVVGSQSVGKSSLIESMSGIALPRNSGTCTRCPMECRLQQASTWSCQVVLRFQYDATGQALAEMKEVSFGPIIFDKDEVADRLERAQRAILSPSVNPDLILNDIHTSSGELTFSANCVCVRIAGPNVPDLYFYDLPGVIANVSDTGKEGDIELVDKLASSYISRPNCLVLLVITCDTDFENQKAGRLVLKSNDHTLKDRTVGVLTKVDRIQPGDEDRWLQIIRGEELVLQNGWYCVKQRGPKELEGRQSWEDAKQQEKQFFSTRAPWCELGSSFAARVGSEALATKLGRILSELVSRELPAIQTQVTRQLAEAKAQSVKLAPANVGQPQTEVIRLLQDFNRTLCKHVEGLPPADAISAGLVNTLNKSYDRFRKRVKDTAPQFRPWSSKLETEDGKSSLVEEMVREDDLLAHSNSPVFHLDEVMDFALQSRTRELPGNFPFSVKEALISHCTGQWREIASQCFQEVSDYLLDHVRYLIETQFGRYTGGGLKADVKHIILSHIQELAESAIQKLDELCQAEATPYTQNEHYFFDYREKLLLRYKAMHRRIRSQTGVVQSLQTHDSTRWPQQYSNDETQWKNINNALAALATAGIPGVVAVDLIKLLPDDSMGPAFEIMAEVRAYFQVAYKRFIDNIPKHIDNAFVRGITQNLDVTLLSRMVNNLTEERCREYLEEPSDVVSRRTELEARVKRLQAAKDRLLEFNQFQHRSNLSATFSV